MDLCWKSDVTIFLIRISCHKTTHANGYYGAWPGWAVSISVLPLTQEGWSETPDASKSQVLNLYIFACIPLAKANYITNLPSMQLGNILLWQWPISREKGDLGKYNIIYQWRSGNSERFFAGSYSQRSKSIGFFSGWDGGLQGEAGTLQGLLWLSRQECWWSGPGRWRLRWRKGSDAGSLTRDWTHALSSDSKAS